MPTSPKPSPAAVELVGLVGYRANCDAHGSACPRPFTLHNSWAEWARKLLSTDDGSRLLAALVDAVREQDAEVCDGLAEHDCNAEQCASTIRALKGGGR